MFQYKKVIIFDLDGTLIDSIGMWNAVDIELIHKLGNTKIDDTHIGQQRDHVIGSFYEAKDCYLEYCGFLQEKYQMPYTKEEIKTIRYEIANRYLEKDIDYKPEAPKVLEILKEQGYTLALGSITTKDVLDIYFHKNENIRSKAKLQDYFSIWLTKEDVKQAKPDPEVHKTIMQRLQVQPKDCLVVEDSLIGVKAANAAQVDVITMKDIHHSPQDLKAIQAQSIYQFQDYPEMLEYLRKELVVMQ